MAIDTKPNFSSNKFEQCTGDTMNLSGCTQIYGYFDMESGSTLSICADAGSGKVLTSNASGVATWQTPATASGENVTLEVIQSSHGFVVNDFIGWSGGTYNKAIADGLYDGEFVGLVTASADTNTFCVTQSGYITGLTASFVANTTYWLSESTAGLLTSTEPTGDGEISKAAFIADTTSSGWVLPYAGVVVSTGETSISTADNGLTVNGGIVGLGGTLCQNTNIDVSGYNLSISGLSGKTTQENAVFVDNATGTLVTGATTAGCGLYSSNNPATCTVGGITVGATLTGQTLEYLLQEILAPYIEPTFSSFAVNITPQPMEVGTALSGSKTFTWATSTCDNVASNSIGICQVGGALSCTGLANDYAESINIGTLTNTGQTTWTWQISGCSTQATPFTRNVSKCSLYPIYYGKLTSGGRPTPDNTLITTGCIAKSAVNSTSTVTVTFSSASNEYTWLAIPSTSTSKTCWYVNGLDNGLINDSPSDKYPDEQVVSVTSAEACWSSINYKVYMSGGVGAIADPIQFRNS